jgi:hypothetical protein
VGAGWSRSNVRLDRRCRIGPRQNRLNDVAPTPEKQMHKQKTGFAAGAGVEPGNESGRFESG